MKNKNLSTTYVHYELYSPYTLKQLNFSCCSKSTIIMNIPTELDQETISLYDSLSQYDYNLFDPNDIFYNDICTIYKSKDGSDIILQDRKNEIYMKNGNKIICQSECSINKYNVAVKKAECLCSTQKEINEPDLKEIVTNFNHTKLLDDFLVPIKNSNFLVLKCYKLLFNSKYMLINIGMIIMTII